MSAKPVYTFFIRNTDLSDVGTYITSVEGKPLDEARAEALATCAEDWGMADTSQLWVQGVLEGEFDVVEWDDEGNH